MKMFITILATIMLSIGSVLFAYLASDEQTRNNRTVFQIVIFMLINEIFAIIAIWYLNCF